MIQLYIVSLIVIQIRQVLARISNLINGIVFSMNLLDPNTEREINHQHAKHIKISMIIVSLVIQVRQVLDS